SRVLSRLPLAGEDHGVYSITARSQVVDRCRAMLARGRALALVDLFPAPLAEGLDGIQACAGRGGMDGVQVYQPAEMAGAESVLNASAPAVLRTWQGHWLNCVIDGEELLMAFLSDDGRTVFQALWSRSPFLCWAYQSALAGELLSSRLQVAVAERWS